MKDRRQRVGDMSVPRFVLEKGGLLELDARLRPAHTRRRRSERPRASSGSCPCHRCVTYRFGSLVRCKAR